MTWMLAAVVAVATAAHAAPPATESPVARLLGATAADGRALVTPEAKEYYASLPEHARELAEKAVGDQLITSPAHLDTILSVRMAPSVFELAMGDRCFLCHTDPEVHSGATLFSTAPGTGDVPVHMDLAAVVSDVHFRRGLSCAGCHGGDPTDPLGHDHPASWPQNAERRRTDRAWIPTFCGRCHSDSTFMRQFNPGLPTDQLEKYRQSRHGMLLAAGDSRAAQCVSCHGVHGIRDAKNPLSRVYPTRVPGTCATCHGDPAHMAGYRLADGSPLPTNQFEEYRTSVHGRALLERGDLGAPACNDCHGNHAATPPEVASVAEICRQCHARNGMLFDSSKHKEAFVAHGWPECDVCHGKHAIAKTSIAMLAPTPGAMCQGCHAKYATANPNCIATANHFYRSLDFLAAAYARLTARTDEFAHRGLDVEPMQNELAKVFDSLQQARSYIHAFDRSTFDQVADEGQASVVAIDALAEKAEDEFLYRTRGLFLAVVLIGLLMLLLLMKLRRMESSRD